MRILLAAFLLSGCVTADTEMLDSRTVIISAHGSAFDSKSGVIKRVMQEAARKGAERGFQYFQIVSAEDASTTGVYTPDTRTSGSIQCAGAFCNYNSTTSGGGPISVVRPGADVMIRFYHSGEQPTGAFSIAEVLAQK